MQDASHPLFQQTPSTGAQSYPPPHSPSFITSPAQQRSSYDEPYEDTDRLGSSQPAAYGNGKGSENRNGNGRAPVKHRGACGAFWSTYNSFNQLWFLGLIVIQSVVVLAMIALVYGTTNSGEGDLPESVIVANPKLETIATYLGLFILATIFELLISLDALQQKNSIQLIFLLAFQCALVAYSAFLPSQLHNSLVGTTADVHSVQTHIRAYAIVIPSVLAASTIGMAWLEWRLYHEFGWDIFKKIGADIQLKNMYLKYQVFVCLLKFTAFFIIGFSIQFLVLVSGTPNAEKVLTIIALPVIVACLILAAVAVRIESRIGVYTFFVLDVAGITYFIWKCVRIYDSSSEGRYLIARKTLTIFSIISILMLLATFVMTGICLLNFDRGLKQAIPPYQWGTGRTTGSRKQNGGAGGEKVQDGLDRTETRMSLD